MPMPVVHQFTYGALNPVVAYLLAFAGSLLALAAAARARAARRPSRRIRWLLTSSVTLGFAIWLMHFMAMIGFDVPDSPVRYDVPLTVGSALIAVVVVSIGVVLVGSGRRSTGKILAGGLFTGLGVAAMHYTGMAAVRLAGHIGYDWSLVGASVAVAVLASTVALWFSLTIRGWGATLSAALVMAAAVWAMHYTGMAAVRVRLDPSAPQVNGINPILLVLPITVVAVAAIVGLVLTALHAVSEEDLTLTVDFERAKS